MGSVFPSVNIRKGSLSLRRRLRIRRRCSGCAWVIVSSWKNHRTSLIRLNNILGRTIDIIGKVSIQRIIRMVWTLLVSHVIPRVTSVMAHPIRVANPVEKTCILNGKKGDA